MQQPAAVPPSRSPRIWKRALGRVALAVVAGAVIFGVVACASAWTAFGTAPAGARLERIKASPQFHDDAFKNPLPEEAPSPGRMATALFEGSDYRRPEEPEPLMLRSGASFKDAPPSGLRVTWLGHSTSLIEIDGARVLADPVWGPVASPVPWLGPERYHVPPLPLDELPPIDAVVISHDHYDHLDLPTIEALLSRPDLKYLVPLGVGAHLEGWGVPASHIAELDWWDERTVAGVRIVCTPARHFSGRSLQSRNTTLWSGWAVIGTAHRAYYTGDSALFPELADVGARYGPFDVTLVESGAYNERWRDVHFGPEQAVIAHQLVRGRLMLPVHWGTFNLALHGWTEPGERVLAAAAKAGVDVALPIPGASVEPTAFTGPATRWWPETPWQRAEEAPVISSHLPPELRARVEALSGLAPGAGPQP